MTSEIVVDTSKNYWALMRPVHTAPFLPFTWTNQSDEPNWKLCKISRVIFIFDTVRIVLNVIGTSFEKEYLLEDFKDLIDAGKVVEDRGYHLEQVEVFDELVPGFGVRTIGSVLCR